MIFVDQRFFFDVLNFVCNRNVMKYGDIVSCVLECECLRMTSALTGTVGKLAGCIISHDHKKSLIKITVYLKICMSD